MHRNFPGAVPNTWYGAALTNELSGNDANGPDTPEISISFNADVDNSEVLGSIGWYYGTDAQPGADVDFATITLHELGHGLGFFDAVDATAGGWQQGDAPAIFDRLLWRPQIANFADMRDGERLAAIISPPLLWAGASATAFNGAAPMLFTPDPFASGSSLSHWDPAAEPGELMAPSYRGAVHDPGLLLPALVDMGWQLAVASPTTRATAATPTPTATARPTLPPTPEGTPPARRDMVYVTNFDDGTVSAIDARNWSRDTTIRVGDGPLGVVASPDGRWLYVANFQAGTLAVVSTRSGRVIATIPVAAAPFGVAVTPDGASIVVTDTASNEVSIVDTAARRVVARAPAGLQPTGIAITPDGQLACVADYGAATVAVIDIATGLRRAIILTDYPTMQSITIAQETGIGYAASYLPGWATRFNTNTLARSGLSLTPQDRTEALAITPDGSMVYAAGHSADSVAGKVAAIRIENSQTLAKISTGDLPAALALSADGRTLYVANAGSNSLSIVDTTIRYAIGTTPVGASPMGVTVAAVPQFCDGDCNGDEAVSVADLLQAMRSALGDQPAGACIAADRNDDGMITIDEIIGAVGNALDGCPQQS